MSETGKNYIAVKVFDKNCDICKHMSKHDRTTFEEFDEIGYQEVLLDDVINNDGNLTKLRIYQLLERHCLSHHDEARYVSRPLARCRHDR
jgi:hypothetical protein